MKSRIFNIAQNENYLNEDTIKIALAHKTIKKWAYVLHDKDVYTEEDEKNNPLHKKGTPKENHFHVVLEMTPLTDIETIAKWFKIAPNFIDIPKGYGAFMECVEYLTHESVKQQAKGKYLYPDKEIKASFKFRDELIKYQNRKLKSGNSETDIDAMCLQVLKEGKTLAQCQEDNALLYIKYMSRLKATRLEYIANQKPPKTRINYYISGRGGLGKGLASRALARTLFPQYKYDDEIYFIVGGENATFEGYDGQPVIIWDDCRAFEMLKILKSRGNVFNILDTHPVKKKQNIKYGSINLCHTVNIINSVQPYIEFLDGLAGEYKTKDGETIQAEDKGQSYRRIPFIINLHEEDFDLLVNKGFMDSNKEFEAYEEYRNIQGNFQKIRTRLKNNEELVKQIEGQVLEIPKKEYDKVIERENQTLHTTDIDMALKEFENYGKQKI